jgi:hypothetical protein
MVGGDLSFRSKVEGFCIREMEGLHFWNNVGNFSVSWLSGRDMADLRLGWLVYEGELGFTCFSWIHEGMLYS